MKALVQRVKEASVEVEGQRISSIGRGLLVLLGVMEGDSDDDAAYLVKKITALRIFPDDEGRMNRSLMDIGGEALVVSQFTLAADTKKGNRPSFVKAMEPTRAEAMYEEFSNALEALGIKVGRGSFGAHMMVSLVNDGPVTIMLESPGR